MYVFRLQVILMSSYVLCRMIAHPWYCKINALLQVTNGSVEQFAVGMWFV
jgi:hypothetical protein